MTKKNIYPVIISKKKCYFWRKLLSRIDHTLKDFEDLVF